ncbi:MAG: hypothetical protein FWD89_01280 [Firmicutes bacterium]|nr:hypothetical protein [Bacillota bacterium]
MTKKRTSKIIFLGLVFLFIGVVFASGLFAVLVLDTNIDAIKAIDSVSAISKTEAESLIEKGYFGKHIKAKLTQEAGLSNNMDIELSVFGLFKLKTKTVKVEDSVEVYAIGEAVSFKCFTKEEEGFFRDTKIYSGEVLGVGTLTYVKKEDNKFGALGHALLDENKKDAVKVVKGTVANASVVSIEKSRAGYAGELKALPNMLTASSIGDIEKNSELGVYGKVNDEWVKKRLKDEVSVLKCGRFSVKPGNAKILAQVNNEPPRLYDIKIVKASKQKNTATRGMVIKITDKELLSKTGGIVQGMSGSPILQDGKLIGAVTHLFLNDPTRGYGVYADFMFEENE